MRLSRSKSASLYVEISTTSTLTPEIGTLASIIKPHLWRCRLLDATFSHPAIAAAFIPLPKFMPYLRYLSITLEPVYETAFPLLPPPPPPPGTPIDLPLLAPGQAEPEANPPVAHNAQPQPQQPAPQEPDQQQLTHLSLFEAESVFCAPHSIQIYAPTDFTLALPKFADLSRLETLGLSLNLPSSQMLRLAANAPELRSLDLSFSGFGSAGAVSPGSSSSVSGVASQLREMAYPRLERQRISGNGVARFVAAPCLRSLTLVDSASMAAVDQLMSSRLPSSPSRSIASAIPSVLPHQSPLFPELRTLTFMTPSPADFDSSPRFNNLARFIREHRLLTALNIMACWSPIPKLLEVALCQQEQRIPNSEQIAEDDAQSSVACSNLASMSLHLDVDVDVAALSTVVEALLIARHGLRVELICRSDFDFGPALRALMRRSEFTGRLVHVARR